MAVCGERLDQVFDHHPQPSYNLQIIRTAGADLAECEVHTKSSQLGGTENHAQLPGFVQYFVGAQMTPADHSEHAMELVNRKEARRRIVDRGRKCLERNIDDDTKGKRGVLFHRAFRS
jgi:hypothetical protein